MAKKRKRGNGSVHLRKDGRWEGRYVVGYNDKGYPQTKNVLARTKRECLEKLQVLKQSYDRPKPSGLRPDMPFGEWIDFWYQNWSKPKLRPKTQLDYENSIYKHIIPELGGIPMDQLTQNDLQQFYIRLKKSGRLLHTELYGKGLSDRMVQGCHIRCRTALGKAVAEGLIRSNPADGCKLPPQSPREMNILTREEMQRFLIQAKEEGYYELFLLEMATGMRRGELLALQWQDLDFNTGELKIERQVYRARGELVIAEPKTKSSIRTIILPPTIINVLAEYKEQITSRWIFPSPKKDDSPLDPTACRKRLQTILDHAQCKPVRFHDLRHTFSTTALEHGIDVKTLSAIIGHVSAATTLNVYAHVTDDMRRAAAANIDRKIGKCKPQEAAKSSNKDIPNETQQTPCGASFEPYKGKRRKAGTGCISMINDHLYEGRYSPIWPDGKKHSRNVYGHTREECEEKLAALIIEMKKEIAEAKTMSGEKCCPPV